ncbi:MAG: winged helix-turn-helix domain-containing protein [archaeon]
MPEESTDIVEGDRETGELAESGGKTAKKKKLRRKAAKPKDKTLEVAPILPESPESKVSYVFTTGKVSDTSVEIKLDSKKPTFTQEIRGAEKSPVPVLTAQDILTKSEKEIRDLEKSESKRDANNLAKNLRIITAILLGKKKNKELSQALQTDKSFTSKQVRELEEQGLVKREGEGKDVSYEVDTWNVLKFLQSKVVIKWKKEEEDKNKEEREKGDKEKDEGKAKQGSASLPKGDGTK